MTKLRDGLDLIVAAGFSAQEDCDADDVMAAQDASGVDLLSVLNLKMIEPSPEIDMQHWLKWFDELAEIVVVFS